MRPLGSDEELNPVVFLLPWPGRAYISDIQYMAQNDRVRNSCSAGASRPTIREPRSTLNVLATNSYLGI